MKSFFLWFVVMQRCHYPRFPCPLEMRSVRRTIASHCWIDFAPRGSSTLSFSLSVPLTLPAPLPLSRTLCQRQALARFSYALLRFFALVRTNWILNSETKPNRTTASTTRLHVWTVEMWDIERPTTLSNQGHISSPSFQPTRTPVPRRSVCTPSPRHALPTSRHAMPRYAVAVAVLGAMLQNIKPHSSSTCCIPYHFISFHFVSFLCNFSNAARCRVRILNL